MVCWSLVPFPAYGKITMGRHGFLVCIHIDRPSSAFSYILLGYWQRWAFLTRTDCLGVQPWSVRFNLDWRLFLAYSKDVRLIAPKALYFYRLLDEGSRSKGCNLASPLKGHNYRFLMAWLAVALLAVNAVVSPTTQLICHVSERYLFKEFRDSFRTEHGFHSSFWISM